MREITVKIQGPYRWFGEESDAIFSTQIADRKGVYLFAAPYRKSFLVEYVGMTQRSFGLRLIEHLQSYFIGEYQIHDTASYLNGEMKHIYIGKYASPTARRKEAYLDFFAHFETYCQEILKNLAAMRLFFLPVDGDKRTMERIEAALSAHLSRQPAPVGKFIDSGVHYRPKRASESPLRIRIENNQQVMGMPDALVV